MMSRWGRGDDGATIIEFAIIVPLLVMLAIGMAEFGLVFKDRLSVSAASQSGARVGATMGTDEGADYAILEAVWANLSGNIDFSLVSSVVIFEDLAGGGMGMANTYVPDGSPCGWAPCPDPATGPSYGGPWDPADRDVELPDPDVLGVRISYQHDWITNIFPFMSGNATFSETARVRLEPAGLESAGS